MKAELRGERSKGGEGGTSKKSEGLEVIGGGEVVDRGERLRGRREGRGGEEEGEGKGGEIRTSLFFL